jgi:D-alanyl-D-alanine carboxypeptidase
MQQKFIKIKRVIIYSLSTFALLFTLGSAVEVSALRKTVIDAPPDSTLQQDVNRLRDIGTVGVLAYTTNGTEARRARAGTAVLGSNTPIDWDSRVRIGSNTKTFVATVLLQLEAEGKLSLNDTVERWLPGIVQGHGNHGDHITIRQLLQHTSGLFDYLEDDAFWATIATPEAFYQNRFNTYLPEQLVAIAVSHAPNFGPGARWEYSNTNYIVAGMIIKAVTGQPWDWEVKQRIITPLGLTGTSEPGTNPHLPAPFPRGYELFDTNGIYTDTTLHNMTWGGAAGSLISTPKDINTFFKALMKGQLLPPAQLAKMQTTVSMGRDYEEFWPGAAYGLGIIRINLPCGGVYWSHGGDVIGYNNTNGVTPDGERSAIVASSTNTFTDAVFAENSIRNSDALVRHTLCSGDTNNDPLVPQPSKNTSNPRQLF